MLGPVGASRRSDPPAYRLRAASSYELPDDDEVEIDALCTSCCRVMTQAPFAWLMLASGYERVCE
jgi:hypothetical protein